MYIPLNAAIVAEVYRNNRKTGLPIPKTLTQVYTQLCLTLLQRYLEDELKSRKIVLKIFSDLSKIDHYHTHFINLSKLAYEGFKKNEIIFYSDKVPVDFVHFGFLDTEPALYGGDGISHNFLHLTLQEFLTAYYISNSITDSQVLKANCYDKRWNVVWRFVSGLTGFEYFKNITGTETFTLTLKDKFEVLPLFIQCLYEAQIEFDYTTAFKTDTITIKSKNASPLDRYALGYCIANSTASWDVIITGKSMESFVWGLNCNKHAPNALQLNLMHVQKTYLSQFPVGILRIITHLGVHYSLNDEDDKITNDACKMAETLPLLIKLDSFMLQAPDMYATPKCYINTLAKCLNSLCDTNLSHLDLILHRDFLNDSSFLTALARLLHPKTGKLNHLTIKSRSTIESLRIPDTIYDILFRSSLSSLHIEITNTWFLTFSFLETNINCRLSNLKVVYSGGIAIADYFFSPIAAFLQKNTTVHTLTLGSFEPMWMDSQITSTIIVALRNNKHLKELNLIFQARAPFNESSLIDDLLSDSRVKVVVSSTYRGNVLIG